MHDMSLRRLHYLIPYCINPEAVFIWHTYKGGFDAKPYRIPYSSVTVLTGYTSVFGV